VTWTLAGGEDGTLLVSGTVFRDSTGELATGSGRTLLATTDFEDVTGTGEQAVAWTIPSRLPGAPLT